MHQIQKYIMKVLTYQATARFSELRPPRTDSNLFSYHLKALVKEGLLEKAQPGGYRLTPQGLFLVDRVSGEKFEPRLQPKLITMTVVEDESGRIGLQERQKQPFIGRWTLPSGKVHLGESLAESAERELCEKAGLEHTVVRHVGDSYIHAYQGEVLVSSVLAHVFTARVRAIPAGSSLRFVPPAEVARYPLLPGVGALIETTCRHSGGRFFLELTDRR